MEYPHSWLAARLRGEVIESTLLFDAGLAYMVTVGGLSGHPDNDLQKAGERIGVMYMDALSMVPFMTGGRSGKDMLSADRQDSIEKYRAMKRRMEKE